MSRYLPAILGVLVIVGLTIPQILMTDRFAGSNFTADQQAELLKNVPERVRRLGRRGHGDHEGSPPGCRRNRRYFARVSQHPHG